MHDAPEFRWSVGTLNDGCRCMQVLVQHPHQRGAVEREASLDHLVRHDAEAILIGGAGHRVSGALLGAHVGGGAHERPHLREDLPFPRLGDPEIGDHRIPVAIEHHVGGLDVAVDHPLAVRIRQCRTHLAQDPDHLRDREGPVLQHVVERFPHQILHHKEGEVASAADQVDRDDVRMGERGDGARLAEEALHRAVGAHQRRRHHLDRDVAPELGVLRQENGGHRAAAEFAHDLELPRRGLAEQEREGRFIEGECREIEGGGEERRRLCAKVGPTLAAEPFPRLDGRTAYGTGRDAGHIIPSSSPRSAGAGVPS